MCMVNNQSHISHNAPAHIPQGTIQNRKVRNGELWDMGQVHFEICEIGLINHILKWSLRSV